MAKKAAKKPTSGITYAATFTTSDPLEAAIVRGELDKKDIKLRDEGGKWSATHTDGKVLEEAAEAYKTKKYSAADFNVLVKGLGLKIVPKGEKTSAKGGKRTPLTEAHRSSLKEFLKTNKEYATKAFNEVHAAFAKAFGGEIPGEPTLKKAAKELGWKGTGKGRQAKKK